jgi:flavin-dependent dehydrogenase
VDASIVIIGAGPAGAVAGRLLAAWGHRPVILDRGDQLANQPRDRARRPKGLAESIPPSARKLFEQAGVLGAVDAAGFYASTGNTVWWGSEDCRIEAFGGPHPRGLQVYRPDLDRVLLECAARAGAEVRHGSVVRAVHFDAGDARVEYHCRGVARALSCEWVLDCSGRSGVLARRYRRPGHRTYALVGSWRTSGGWDLPDSSHTVVEAYERGWAWSIPTSETLRQAGVMIDGSSPRRAGATALTDAYRNEIARTARFERHLREAALDEVWACDASTYSSSAYGGRNFLLVGDAGSFVDPLSSFGVKKAIGSAWMASVVVNTSLRHSDRQEAALELFSAWHREVDATHTARSAAFARQAAARFPDPFWTTRAASGAGPARPASPDAEVALRAALRQIQERDELDLTLDQTLAYEQRPVIRDREVVLEDAFPSGIRFRENVDLLTLARLAGECRRLPELLDAYARSQGPAPLPDVLGGLSLLVAKGFLVRKDGSRCRTA